MRLRPFAALSVAAVSAVLLAGCASDSPDADPTATDDAATSICDSAVPSGSVSEAISVEGEQGEPATATFEAPLTIASAERTVLVEGDGDAIADGDLVQYGVTIYDAATGEQATAEGYDPALLPVQVSLGSGADQFFGCATIGSRLVMALPETENSSAAVWVLDVLGTSPAAAWGEEQEPVDGFPTVELDEDGTPNIEVPETDPPAETEVAVLKKGDGAVVESGDSVTIQFRGARWSTGELFDGGDTWASGTPYSAATTGFVTGFATAMEGQTVGSQVLVVITPADGYGEGEINEDDLVGETLVFVIDILAAQPAAE